MNSSVVRSANQSPQQKFSKLNQSQQLIPEEILPATLVSINQSPRKEIFKKGIRKTYYLKDNERKKTVGCHIYYNEMSPSQLALSKKGRYCRICMNDEETSRFIHPCRCKGSLKYVHEECFKSWILQKNTIEHVIKNEVKCEVCQYNIVMKLHLQDQVQKHLYHQVPKHKKVCWLILIFIILMLILGAVLLGILTSPINIAIAAVITLLGVVSAVILIYLIASIVQSISIEMIDQWIILSYSAELEDKIGMEITVPQQLNNSPRSPKTRRKSIAPVSNGGLQVIQFNMYPAQM